MKDSLLKLKKVQDDFRGWNKSYKKLRKHLDTMPVGYPSTFSGAELRILRSLFSVPEAEIALYMTYKPETFETIYSRADKNGISQDRLERNLEDMDRKGSIMMKEIDNIKFYSLVPFVYGMFETQVSNLTLAFYLDSYEYLAKGFGLEFLSSNPSQVRVIPIEKSIGPEHKIAVYDEIREVIHKSEGRIGVAECMCKKSKDLLNEPCLVTERREICLVFREGHDLFTRHGWARSVTTEEALELISVSEKDGLVLMAGNEEEVNFICCCCHCCCGFTQIYGSLPGPSDFVASNYQAELDIDACNGCGKCEKRCQFGAIRIIEKKAALKKKRCVGCGLCVSTCKAEAIQLNKKETPHIPPKTVDDLYDTIMKNKKNKFSRYINTSLKVLRSGKER